MRWVFLCLCGVLLLTLPTVAQDDAWQAAMDAGRTAASEEARITAYAKAVELAQKFSADDDRIHECSLALAQAYDRTSRPDDANQVISSLLARRLRALGLADPKLATTYLAIGDYYLSFGNFDAAKPQFDRALAICTKAYGEGDPRLAPCYTGLGEYYRRKNDPREAVAALQTAIALIEKGGKESPDLAKPLMRLASLYQNLRTLPEAETALTRALAVLEKAYGPEDAKLVEAQQAMGAYYWYAARKPELGLPYYERALAIQEKALKPDDPQMLSSLQSLAALSSALRRFNDAVRYYRRLLAAQEAKEPGGRYALYARVGLATALIRAKQMPEAREETDRLFTAAAKLTDSNGYYMLQDFHRQIAQAYHQAGAYTEAETAYREWLKFVEKTPEPSRGGVRIDPLGNAMNNWAGFYRNFGREAEAEKLLRRVAEQYQARGNVPDTTLVALAECLLSQNDIPEAEAQLKRSMSDPGSGYRPIIWAQALLPLYRGLAIMHAAAPLPGPGRSLSGVELDIMSRKPDAAAREAFAAAEPLLKAVKEHWDAEKRSTSEYNAQYTNYYNALAINSYASALIVQGKFAEAKPLLAKGRELAEAAQPVLLQSGRDIRVSGNIVFGELAPFFITQAALRFRELQAAQGSPKDVLADVVAPLEVALAERAELYGTWSPQYGRVLLNLGTAYAVTGETDKAKKALSEAKALFEGMLGKDDPAVATIAARLEKLK